MTTVEFNTDIQMINVAHEGDMHHVGDFPYGMALMVGYLREQGINTKLLQYPTWRKEEFIDEILDNPAYLYGFQVNMENYQDISALVQQIRASNPAGKIIFGGPFVVSFYEELLKHDPDLDAVVLGEGEYTVAELVQKLKDGDTDWKLSNGLAWLNDEGELTINPHRQAIQDMNTMPYAARDRLGEGFYDIEGKYLRDVRITTSRGCTSNCSFCGVNTNSRWQKAKQWRGRSAINVVDEIQEVAEKYNVKLFNLQDSAFDDPGKLGAKRTRLFCEEILKRGLEISMKAYFRAHQVKDDPESIELYKLYKEAGIDVIHIGAEAGSDYELEMYWKDAKLEDNFRSFRVMDSLNLFFMHNGFIMFGPYSTMDTLRENIRFLWEIQRSFHFPNLDCTLICTPGAAIHDHMLQEGRLLPRENFWECPAYEFGDPRILAMAKHYMGLRATYPHTHSGDSSLITAQNIMSRFRNKMNKKVFQDCGPEISEFEKIFYRNKKILNDLGYQGFLDSINRIELDGPNARLDPDPYFGKAWADSIIEVESGYETLITAIQAKGFGLGGLVYDAQNTAWSLANRDHFHLDGLNDQGVANEAPTLADD